MQKSHMSKV